MSCDGMSGKPVPWRFIVVFLSASESETADEDNAVMLSRVGTSPLPSPALPANSVGTHLQPPRRRGAIVRGEEPAWPRGGARAPDPVCEEQRCNQGFACINATERSIGHLRQDGRRRGAAKRRHSTSDIALAGTAPREEPAAQRSIRRGSAGASSRRPRFRRVRRN